jgi:hypothetical protein
MEAHGSGVVWRIGNAERRLDAIEQLAKDIPVIRRDIEVVMKDLDEIRDELKSSKRATWAVFLAIFSVGITLAANVVAGTLG